MIAKRDGSNDTRDTDKCRNRQLYTDLSAWITAAKKNCPTFERTGCHEMLEEYKGSF